MSIRAIVRSVEDAWGAHWDEIHQASKNRRLLLVEGDDDKAVVEELLRTLDPLWQGKVHVGAAGDRDKVLGKVAKKADVLGLVDRDVWDEEDVTQRATANLVITSGWCMENHFCAPAPLEAMFSLPAGSLVGPVEAAANGWIAHGSIWWTVQRLRNRIGAALPSIHLGHPGKDSGALIADESELRRHLSGYVSVLGSSSVDHLIQAIQDRHRAISSLPLAEAIERGIHGKRFFMEVISPSLSRVIGQRDATSWRNIIARGFGGLWPDYLIQFARRLLA